MGVGHQFNLIFAILQFITEVLVFVYIISIVALHVGHGKRKRYGSRLAWFYGDSLFKIPEVDVGLFYAALIILGRVVKFEHVLYCHLPVIGDVHRYLDSIRRHKSTAGRGRNFLYIPDNVVLVDIAESVTKGILHNCFKARLAVPGRFIPYSFGIRRLVPLISDVDVLYVIYIRPAVSVGRTRILVRPYKQKIVAIGVAAFAFQTGVVVVYVGFEFIGIGICKPAGGRNVAVNDCGKGVRRIYTRAAHYKTGVKPWYGVQKTQLHGVCGINDDNDVFKCFANVFQKPFFFLAYLQIGTAFVRGLVVLILHAGRVLCLARYSAYHDECRVGIGLCSTLD